MTAKDAGTPMPERPRDGAARSVGRPERAAEFMPRTRPVVPPIHHSVTYFLDDRAYKDVQDGGLREHWYSRFRNPTVDAAARRDRRPGGRRRRIDDLVRHGGDLHDAADSRPGGRSPRGRASGVRRHP